MPDTKIVVRVTPEFRPLRAVWSALNMIVVIGVGVVLDSDAMQWAGFVAIMLIGLAASIAHNTTSDRLSIDEARRLIDEIEKAGDWSLRKSSHTLQKRH